MKAVAGSRQCCGGCCAAESGKGQRATAGGNFAEPEALWLSGAKSRREMWFCSTCTVLPCCQTRLLEECG
ncbi:hypothetical protein AAT19DRAFT_11585 [Rhodotorula toruloides]|uniref:Uncharacterized protein n=1 Tax=Rhodotorula toruloides TaxID=5286 RepID=A0A2S9ZVZ9_RHOTO|nr:hypothetical protein AAT19DRAFT_11585 [Rhodotorula toruloides]